VLIKNQNKSQSSGVIKQDTRSVVTEQDVFTSDLLNLLNDTDISHEIRTPLTVIKGFGELLLNSNNLDLVQRQNLHIILQNEARLELVVQKIEKILGAFREKISNK